MSPNGVLQGRAEILARYKKRYQDQGPSSMGTLRFELVDIYIGAAADTATAALKWFLAFDPSLGKADTDGHALVVFRRRGPGWQLVQDASM